MRELNLSELGCVSGGQEGPLPEESRQDPVSVVGQRPSMSSWEIDNLINSLGLGDSLLGISDSLVAGLDGFGNAAGSALDQAQAEVDEAIEGCEAEFAAAVDATDALGVAQSALGFTMGDTPETASDAQREAYQHVSNVAYGLERVDEATLAQEIALANLHECTSASE